MPRGGPPDERRLVEIRCTTANSYGTGYLLDRNIVLTAAHVLWERGGTAPSGDLAIEAVPFGRRTGRDSDFEKADLVWPSAERVGDLTRPDLALIRLTRPLENQPDTGPTLLGPGELPSGTTLDVSATGFPRFRYDRASRNTVTHQIIGELSPQSGMSPDPAESCYEITTKLTQQKKLTGEQWGGISGSALFAEDRLIGVVKVSIQDRNELDIDFTASRLKSVENDTEFLAAIGDAGTFGTTPPARRPFPPLPGYVCLLDRNPQEIQFSKELTEITKGLDGVSLVCVLAGLPEHLPSEMPKRLHLHTLPRFHRWESAGFRVLSWPSTVTNLDEAILSLRLQLARALAKPEEEPPANVTAISKLIADPTRPRLFCSDLRKTTVARENVAVQAGVMERWLTLLGELATTPQRPPVHLVTVHDAAWEDVRAWLACVKSPPRVQVCLLPPLESCFPGDLDEWLDVRLRERLSGADNGYLERFALRMREKFDGEFVLRDLRREITAYVEKYAEAG